MSEPRFVAISKSQFGGIVTVNVFAMLSTLALISVACRVIWLAIRQKVLDKSSEPKEYIFFNTQLGHYAACLLIANLFIDIAGLIGLRWAVEKGITEDALCTLQAVLMQVGSWGTAYFTVVIAVHTFNSLVLRIRQSLIVAITTITVGWITAGLLASAPFLAPGQYELGPGYGASGLSCGVRSVYLKAQFFLHLFPIFVASVFSAILYSLIFLVLRGTLSIKGGIKLVLDPQERWVLGPVTENYHRFVARIARSMLWYPIAYIALLVPYSVTRLLDISGFTVAPQAMIFAYTCWFALGVVNVLLLYNTFRVLGPAFDSPSQRETLMSFGPGGLFERYEPDTVDEKVDRHRFPKPSYRSPTIESFGPASPPSSVRPLLPHERSASVQSYYSYPSSPPIGRAITPVNDLRPTISPPEPAVQKYSPTTSTRALLDHTRQGSTDSIGLPAAPRRTRSPVLHQPSLESIRSSSRTGNVPAERHISIPRHPSRETFGKRNSASPRMYANAELSPDHDPANWDSRSAGYATSSPKGSHSRMLSSANTASMSPAGSPGSANFLKPLASQPRHSRSFSAVPTLAPAPEGRRRAGLVSRHGSFGNASEMSHSRQGSGQSRAYYV